MGKRCCGWFVGIFLSLSGLALAADPRPADLKWDNPELWRWLSTHSVDFFPFDSATGTCPVWITNAGLEGHGVMGQIRTERHLTALAQAAYGYAVDTRRQSLLRAESIVNFIRRNMVAHDKIGPYFIPMVQANGRAAGVLPPLLSISEQAQALGAYVALYRKNPNAGLWADIEEMYHSFLARFRDPRKGMGLYARFNLSTGRAVSEDKNYAVKNFNSLVTPATIFLFDLLRVTAGSREHHSVNSSAFFLIAELSQIVRDHMYDAKTGWLIEEFDADLNESWGAKSWQVVRGDTLGVVGRNFHAAWFLLRTSNEHAINIHDEPANVQLAHVILESMLAKNGIDRTPEGDINGVFNCLRRNRNDLWSFPEDRGPTKWWWQQAEAILALTLAERMRVLTTGDARFVRDGTIRYFFESFVDDRQGGEFAEIMQSGTPLSFYKGYPERSMYHTLELARYMLEYIARESPEREAWMRVPLATWLRDH